MKYTGTWSKEKLDFIERLYKRKYKLSKITDKFNEKFKTRVTNNTINNTMYQYGIKLTESEKLEMNLISCAENAKRYSKEYDLKVGSKYRIMEKMKTDEKFLPVAKNMIFVGMNSRLLWFKSECGYLTCFLRNNNIFRCAELKEMME